MPYQDLEPISKQVTIVVGLTVVGFMAFGLALSFYRNALFDQTLQNISNRNQELKQVIASGYQRLDYYRSAQYKDKYAKENLGLINPGEKVLIITQAALAPTFKQQDQDITTSEQKEAAYLELLRQMPVYQHWQLYLFHPEKMADLQAML